ncbi:hypothetical protein WA026_022457 [Henosepilachna vigintioctopunctata]|uniref:Uncharacterized protein n=1 Tax=Henosepilachna vigintioctopunctata TaxID=420089 RepID=A0AAW1TRG8_9CUCU
MLDRWNSDHFFKFNDTDIMKLLDTSNDCIHFKDNNGWTLLHCTVSTGNVYYTKKLLKMGADVNATNDWGCTPLHVACAGNNEDCINVLLDYKPLLNVKHVDMFSCLHTFLILGELNNEQLLERMLREGADPNIHDGNGNTPLHIMCAQKEMKKSLSFVRLLLEYNADINSTNNEGKTPLHLAIENVCEEMVDFLLKNDADINIADKNGVTPPMLSFSKPIIKGNIMILIGKHLIMKHICYEDVDVKILHVFLKFGPFINFMLKCESERQTLQRRTIDTSNVTYYDILIAPPRQVEKYLRNPNILKSLLSFDDSKYIFGNRIVKKVEAGMRRSEAAEKLYKIFSYRFPLVRNLCIDMIMAYLNCKNLEIIENL